MQLRARLSAVNGKAATSADQPNKVSVKLDPLYIGDVEASWLFDHLGQYIDVRLEPSVVPRTPLEEAIDGSAN